MAVALEECQARAEDGVELFTWRLRPDGAAKGAVLLSHGFAEHSGRHRHVAEALAARGFVVQAFDHRTHGRSGGRPRIDLPDVERVVADLRLQAGLLRAAAPGRPLFLYGHSLGAFLGLAALVREPGLVDGFVSSGLPIDADTTVSPGLLRLADVLGRLLPRLPLVPVALKAVSRDPRVVAAYRADPLVHAGRMRARMCSRLNAEGRSLRARLPELRLPLLVLHGEADRIAPASGSRRLYERAGSADKTLRLYPGLWHEVHNEPEQAQVLGDVAAWLVERCPA